MFLVIDENVARNAAEFLRDRGHRVEFVTQWLGQGTPDEAIAIVADLESAIIVTHDKDFDRIIARAARETGGRSKNSFKRLGRISLRCSEPAARQRLEAAIDLIEFEFARAQKQRDCRLIVEIKSTTITVIR